MNTFELPFAKVIRLDGSSAEIIVDEGVELNSEMVAQFHKVLKDEFTPPIGIFVNKINQYAYTFQAQLILGDLAEVVAIAVVVYSEISRKTTEAFRSLPRKLPLNLKIFDSRKQAIKWLNEEIRQKQTTVLGVP